jgi:hypothetical protein
VADQKKNRDDMNAGSNSGSNSGMNASGSDSNRGGRVSQADSSQENRTDKLGKDRVVGRGMSSPDSTEAVLDASTGEPDPRARGEGSLPSGNDSNRGMSGNSGGSNSGGMSGGSRTAEQESHLSSGKSGGKKS